MRLLQREHLVDHRRQQRVARLRLLGHARADEDAAHIVAVELLHRQRGGDHRGHDRHEAVDHLRVVLAHVLGHGRAGGRDVHARRIRLQVLRVGTAHQVGALRDLHDVLEPGRPEGADELRGRHVEARRERRRQQRGHRGVLLEQPGRPLQPAQVRLGVLGADQGAVAAGDAALVDHERLAVLDADRLRRAVAHAGVAPAAVLLDGRDDRAAKSHAGSSQRRDFVGAAVGVGTVQQAMGDLAQRTAEEVFVQGLHVGVLVGAPGAGAPVHFVEALQPLLDHLRVGVVGLPAAADAATRAAHDLDEVHAGLGCEEAVHGLPDPAEAVDHGQVQLHVAGGDGEAAHALRAAGLGDLGPAVQLLCPRSAWPPCGRPPPSRRRCRRRAGRRRSPRRTARPAASGR